jgi:hypothetical protein
MPQLTERNSTMNYHPTHRFPAVTLSFLLLGFSVQPCSLAGPLTDAQLQTELDALRQVRRGHFMENSSSVLGKLPSPAEQAKTQVDFRKQFMGKTPRSLSGTEKKRALAQFGYVTFHLPTRSGRATFPLGITGAHLREMRGQSATTVETIEADSSAVGALEVGDIIIGAYGHFFPEDDDPRIPLGYALADAQTEPKNGILILNTVRSGKLIEAKIKVGLQGNYSSTWPYDCNKSNAVADAAASYIVNNIEAERLDVFYDTLFLLGTGRPDALEAVRRRLYKMIDQKNLGFGGLNSWGNGYSLVSLAEYYLLTGDSAVVPPIKKLVKVLSDGQMTCGSWSHSCPPGGYGAVNNVGLVCFMGLVLAREAGIEVDADVMLRSIRFFGRGIGTFTPYGDHTYFSPRMWRYLPASDNGSSSMSALDFYLLGSPDLARRTARQPCYQYRTRLAGHAARIFTIGWGPAGAALAPKEEFHMFMNNLIWYFELARRRNGSMTPLAGGWCPGTGAIALNLTLPRKKLRVLGAEKSVFAMKLPAGLKKARQLYADKSWSVFKESVNEFLAKPGQANNKHARGLLAAYQQIETNAAATLDLIRVNLEKKNKDTAERQLAALRILIGEERIELKALAAQIEKTQHVQAKPPAQKASTRQKKASHNLPDKWDILLAAGNEAKDEYLHGEFTSDEVAALGAWYAEGDISPTGMKLRSGSHRANGRKQHLIRRTFEMDEFYSSLRITTEEGLEGEIYVNGKRMALFAKSKSGGRRTLDLGEKGGELLVVGVNTIAARIFRGGNILFEVAAGPGERDMKSLREYSPSFSPPGYTNGWGPSRDRVARNTSWSFKDKSPREIARYLISPDCGVCDATATELASKGKAVVPLLKQLVNDTHPGIRTGAWDAVVALHKQGDLADRKDHEAFLKIAGNRANAEDSWVQQALIRAIDAFGIENEDAHKVLISMAGSFDPGTRLRALAMFNPRGGKFRNGNPAAAVKVAASVAGNLEGADAGYWGIPWSILRQHKETPEARAAAPVVALVLDKVSHGLRGMFSNGVMDGAIPVIDHHIDAELEKTPGLISGISKCYIKGPKINWTGWWIARYKLKHVIYKLSPTAAPELRRVAASQRAWLKSASEQEVNYLANAPREIVEADIRELEAWADAVEKLDGKNDYQELEALARSDDPAKRNVAVSAVWADRLPDPAQAVKIATLVASNTKTNTSRHWHLAWETIGRHKKLKESKEAIPVIAKVLDEVAHDMRGWISMHVIEYAAPILLHHWSPKIEKTPGLVSGLCKCLAKSAADGYWGGANKSLRQVTSKLTAQSHATAKAAHESMTGWLAKAPNMEVERIVAHHHYRGGKARKHLEKNVGELGALVQRLGIGQ